MNLEGYKNQKWSSSDKVEAHKKPCAAVFHSLSVEEWNSSYALS